MAPSPVSVSARSLRLRHWRQSSRLSYEVGTNLGFWKNRASIDAAYFNTVSTSQIFNVGIRLPQVLLPKTVNAGKMTNKGIELLGNSDAFSHDKL